MNRLVIPSILAATVLVAGMFAFMPIEKATTVHTGIQSTITATINDLTTTTVATIADGGTFLIATTEPKLINGRVVVLAVPASADLVFNLRSDDNFDGTFGGAGELNQASTAAGVIDVSFTGRGALQLFDDDPVGNADAVDIDNDQVILLIERFT